MEDKSHITDPTVHPELLKVIPNKETLSKLKALSKLYRGTKSRTSFLIMLSTIMPHLSKEALIAVADGVEVFIKYSKPD